MPPRITTASDATSGIGPWWRDQPPITKYYAAGILVSFVLYKMRVLSPMWLLLLWPNVLKKFEIWRLLTCFLFLPLKPMDIITRVIWLATHGTSLEKQQAPSDYLYMMLFNGVLTLATCYFMGWQWFQGVMLVMSIIYVWARNVPDADMSLYGLIKIKSFYLPFAYTFLTMLFDGPWQADLAGIVIGHIYHFLHDIYPNQEGGKDLLSTPRWVKRIAAELGLRPAWQASAAPTMNPVTGAPQGVSAFQGRGRRLGDN